MANPKIVNLGHVMIHYAYDCDTCMQEVQNNASFLLENTVIPTPVMCTDSDDPTNIARFCIPVTIIVFAESNRLTQAIAMRIIKGVYNAAQVNDIKAV